ncbi:MAG: phosphomannomutase [Gammaproteobacteria bacterium]|uniref:phosphomannomutase n=1 Tax=Pseudomaricurvus alcaniphilus TaxID=1166482 RepID=UPI00140A1490|nr:phosphomannomutase [Pseudomaricurvus alcaniphilus]MBR9910483.1 phosphomannomutase [Gammaproteobacteria bacterium]NHN39718.1 phosphomannomutase [Pseudomaricurvus alcaniphilus]
MTTLTCFKAYDIRGRLPDELNTDIAYRIGRAYASYLKPGRVVVGHDIRLTSAELTDALAEGLLDAGVDVIHIGQVGTEEIYFATFHLGVDGGICVTASHNPKDYNGMKLVREGSRPISGDTGLREIQKLAEANDFAPPGQRGTLQQLDNRAAYVEHLLTYIDRDQLRPLRVVCNAGNGGAGMVIDAIERFLPLEFIKVHHEPDGNFPHGVPNPLLEENRESTTAAIGEHQADLGIAWDGDFDRCFFFDASGRFIEGYYLVGLLAEVFLLKHPGEAIVHDPRLTWNTRAMVEKMGGRPVQSKTGHAFIKERMRLEDAVYGGEMSAHHYFREFAYCDSGMIPWLLVTELMCRSGKTLAELVDDCIALFPCSGEINNKIDDPKAAMAKVEKHYQELATEVDYTDGLSMSFGDWRFNLRSSNTEPVVRLNVESRGDYPLMERKRDELLGLLGA